MRIISSVLISLVIFGCGIMSVIFGSPQPYIHRDVKTSELLGTWTVTAESAAKQDAGIERFPGWRAMVPWRSMTLTGDHSCQVNLEPKWLGEHEISGLATAEASHAALASCKWELTTLSSVEDKNVTGLRVDAGTLGQAPIGADFYIDEDNGGLVLWNFIGDPDDFVTLDYRKSP